MCLCDSFSKIEIFCWCWYCVDSRKPKPEIQARQLISLMYVYNGIKWSIQTWAFPEKWVNRDSYLRHCPSCIQAHPENVGPILHPAIAQVYIPKRRTLIQVLPFLKFLCYLLMHEQIGVRIGWRKYLYECTPFGYANLWLSEGIILQLWHHILGSIAIGCRNFC